MVYEKPDYSKYFWNKLFNRYYHDEIIDLVTKFTKNGTLKIEFADMKRVWGSIGKTTTSGIEFLVNNPNQALLDANDTLHKICIPFDPPEGWSEKAHVEISGVEPVMAILDIRHEHLEKLVSVTGTVAQANPVRPKIVDAAFKCMRCDHITRVMQGDEKLLEPSECENEVCGRKGPFKLSLGESKFVNYQEIILQDSTGAEIEVVLFDNLATFFYSTQEVTITGIVRARQKLKGKAKTPFLEMYLQANHIEVSKMYESDVMLSSHA